MPHTLSPGFWNLPPPDAAAVLFFNDSDEMCEGLIVKDLEQILSLPTDALCAFCTFWRRVLVLTLGDNHF